MARLKFFIGICLALTLTGIVFVVLYSIIFITQPLNAISPIDQKFFEMIIPIATFLTGTLSGIMLAGGSKEEMDMHLEFKRKTLEDQDHQRDAMRKMTWFALFGMLLYPTTIMVTSFLGLDTAAGIIGDIAPTYFIAISALVAAFFGADAYKNKGGE